MDQKERDQILREYLPKYVEKELGIFEHLGVVFDQGKINARKGSTDHEITIPQKYIELSQIEVIVRAAYQD